ncbi:hypothetical protein ACFY3O_28085 [Streptomyces sp. NPDC001046]|uniref:hypothetical protein n=1 Tax=Streptomyces sp. NPDC001046 TaxID=3364543 RepID=UPI003697CB10
MNPMKPHSRARWAGALAVLFAGGSLLIAPSAQGEESRPTDAELLAKCENGTKKCVFHPSGPLVETAGKRRKVGDEAYNCTPRLQRSGITWSDTVDETNSVGNSATIGAGFGGPLSLSVSTSFEKTWKKSRTESATTFIDVRPYQVGWLERTPDLQKVEGTYELIFEDRFEGKRYWYVPFEATAPLETSSMVQRTRPMTKSEKKNHC